MTTKMLSRRGFIRSSCLIAGATLATQIVPGTGRLLRVSGRSLQRTAIATPTINTIIGGGPIGDGKPATSATLSTPLGVSIDTQGNLYIADSYFMVIRKVDGRTQTISTVAGSRIPGYTGDFGPALQATITLPYDAVVDADGNLFITDNANSAIRRVDAVTKVITTFVGTHTAGYNGESLPPYLTQLFGPRATEFDPNGNLVIADSLNFRIRLVNMGARPIVIYPQAPRPIVIAPNTVATIAGNDPTHGVLNDGVFALNAFLPLPTDIAYDSKGNLYIGYENDARVRRIDKNTGIITTVAGNGKKGLTGDGGPALQATFISPSNIALDSKDNLYILDESTNSLRQVDASTGIITTYCGSNGRGFYGDGNPINGSTPVLFNSPLAVRVDKQDNIYVSDYGNNRVRRIDAQTKVITTVAGSANVGDFAFALRATLVEPAGFALDASGALYIADQGDHRIRVVGGPNNTIATVVGTGLSGFYGDGGPAKVARLSSPDDVKFDPTGHMYIADLGNNRIRRVDAQTRIITTVAGNGSNGFSGDGGPATAASFADTRAIAIDANGNLYIADLFNCRIRFVNMGNSPIILYQGTSAAQTVLPGVIVTVVGIGVAGGAGDGGPANLAQLNYPRALAFDRSGNLFIAEGGTGEHPGSRIRRVDAGTGIITKIAGNNTGGFGGDGGPAILATLNGPRGLDIDANGNIAIADTLNERVRYIDARTGTISTLAGGGGQPGFSGDGGPAYPASLFYPRYVKFNAAGNLFVNDSGNGRIRIIQLT